MRGLKVKRLFAAMFIFVLIMGSSAAEVCADKQTALDLTSEEREFLTSHDTLRVGYVQDRVPVSFSDENGELAGISRYIFDRVSEICGVKFEYIPLPAGDVTYDYITEQKLDLVTSVEYNEENQNARGILISNPYFSSRKVVVSKGDLDFRYDADLSVAISTGSQTLRKVLGKTYPNFELKDYGSIPECFDAVKTGDADLMIQNQYVVEYWFAKPKYEKLKVIPVIGLDDKLCFSAVVAIDSTDGGLSKQDGLTLIDILNKAIASMTEDEVSNYTIQAIMETQYQYTIEDFLSRYRYAVGIFIVSFIVIMILAMLLIRQRLRFAESNAESKAKEEFLNTMSHEIRTPLNGLVGLNSLMQQNLDDKVKLDEYLSQSTVTTKYLLSLVNDILDTSKLQAEKLELVLRPITLGKMLEDINSLVQNSMSDKGLNYNVKADIICPVVMGDEVRIQQVLLNLLDNARKFTSKGGFVDLILSQEIQDDNKVFTTVKVKDTGKGMSEEFQKHIFDVFAQERDTVSKGNQGTGLGLSISQRLAMLMGGSLTCESKKGKGSTFTFTFLADAVNKPESDANSIKETGNGHPRILVAEDNELNGEIIIELLHGSGFEAELAENGKKAYDMFKASAPGTYGVILMDILMPVMNGFEATKAIRELDRPDAKTVRIFACTANSFSEDREQALESGMDEFITKPVDINELIRKLTNN